MDESAFIVRSISCIKRVDLRNLNEGLVIEIRIGRENTFFHVSKGR